MLSTLNFRSNPGLKIDGCNPFPQVILADLYKEGKFVRTAAVADLGTGNKGVISRYCNLKNWEYRILNPYSDLPSNFMMELIA